MTTAALTERQLLLLTEIVRRSIAADLPIASDDLSAQFGISPATVRNEFARLDELGYLEKPHISSGRIPTDAAFRLYVDGLQPKAVGRTGHRFARRLEAKAGTAAELAREAAVTLSELTRTFSFADIGAPYFHGFGHLFAELEAMAETAAAIGELLDEFEERIADLPQAQTAVFVGKQPSGFGIPHTTVIISRVTAPQINGVIGIVGPRRISYEEVIPLVRYAGQFLEKHYE